jgi:hypothetical protein
MKTITAEWENNQTFNRLSIFEISRHQLSPFRAFSLDPFPHPSFRLLQVSEPVGIIIIQS